MNRQIMVTGSLFGAIAVILGAFGAHGLKNTINAGELEIWAKGVEYQFYHVFALLFLSKWKIENGRLIKFAYYFFTLGILLFSGSLYLLATRNVLNISAVDYIGPVTPLGGLLLIMGWGTVFLAAIKTQ